MRATVVMTNMLTIYTSRFPTCVVAVGVSYCQAFKINIITTENKSAFNILKRLFGLTSC